MKLKSILNNQKFNVYLFIFLNFWDAIATIYVISKSGIEVAPISHWIIQHFGAFGLATYKVLLPALFAWILLKFSKMVNQAAFLRIMRPINIMMGLACIFMTISCAITFIGTRI